MSRMSPYTIIVAEALFVQSRGGEGVSGSGTRVTAQELSLGGVSHKASRSGRWSGPRAMGSRAHGLGLSFGSTWLGGQGASPSREVCAGGLESRCRCANLLG